MLPLLYLWDTKAMYLGPNVESGEHAHNAFQIIISLDGTNKVKVNGEWREGSVIVVNPNEKHQTVFLGRVAMLFMDAEASGISFNEENLCLSKEALLALKECYEKAPSLSEAEAVYNRVLTEMGSFTVPHELDERIQRCLEIIDQGLSEKLEMETLCSQVGISESTFSHLFSKQVGLPFRRYVVWRRIRKCIDVFLEKDVSLTEAASDLGFTDQSHFNRSFKEIFGVTPGFILGKKLKVLNAFKRVKTK